MWASCDLVCRVCSTLNREIARERDREREIQRERDRERGRKMMYADVFLTLHTHTHTHTHVVARTGSAREGADAGKGARG